MASLTTSQKESDRQLRKQLKELSKQISGLGEKFWNFFGRFGALINNQEVNRTVCIEVFSPRVKAHQANETLVLNVLAYTNDTRNVNLFTTDLCTVKKPPCPSPLKLTRITSIIKVRFDLLTP